MAGRTVRHLAGNGSGQSLVDRITSIKHSISGSLIAKSICKATTEELIAPKRKHLRLLIACTYEPRLSMPEFTNFIIGRSHNSSWVVSFKALVTIHHLMTCGSEHFSQYMASNNCQLAAPRSFDKNCSQFAMLSFIRNYGRYLDARSSSYREVAFDFCKTKKRAEDSDMKTMPPSKLFKVLPALERQIDALVAVDVSSHELTNAVILAAYLLLYKDLIRLYAAYNEGMINIIEKFFAMSKKDCQEGLRFYKDFTKRMQSVNQFVRVAEACESLQLNDGFGKQSLIFKPVPTSVLAALEQHLAYLEGKKPTDLTLSSPTSSSSLPSQPSLITSNLPALQRVNQHQREVIIEEERRRLETFVNQARSKCPTPKEEEVSGFGARSDSGNDLLHLFDDIASNTASVSTPPNHNNLFDDFFFEPANPSNSLSETTRANALATQPPQHLTHFHPRDHPSLYPPGLNPNNPFLQAVSTASASFTVDEPLLNNATTAPAISKPTEAPPHTAGDLDSRLAELAGQLTIGRGTGVSESVTPWGAPVRSSITPAPLSSLNPFGNSCALQPTPINPSFLSHQMLPQSGVRVLPTVPTMTPYQQIQPHYQMLQPRPPFAPTFVVPSTQMNSFQSPQCKIPTSGQTAANTQVNSLNPFL